MPQRYRYTKSRAKKWGTKNQVEAVAGVAMMMIGKTLDGRRRVK
jgi:hypothetical protein